MNERVKKGLWRWVIFGVSAILTYAFMSLMWSSTSYPAEIAQDETTYTVVKGEYLSLIADRYGTTWQKLWELNPEIADPNIIYSGQVIRIRGKTIKPAKILTPDEFKTKITSLMFTEAVLEEEDPVDLLMQMKEIAGNIWVLTKEGNHAGVRRLGAKLITVSRKAEIHALAEAITSVYETDKERAYVLVALAWQESHFVNRRGKAGEVGFYQFLPSTIRGIFGKELFELKLRELEDDPAKATEFANWYLTKLVEQYGSVNSALYRYNGHPEYAGYVITKLEKVKKSLK